MMPEECATIRSIARWVLPVLVGPSTAVTPAPGARSWANGEEDDGKAMFYWVFCVAAGWALIRKWNTRGSETVPQCDALRPRIRFWNESGTNRARIGDSHRMLLRSPQ